MMEFGFYNQDCMEGMKQFPDGFFDLAIVDPPYGINATRFNNGAGYQRSADGSTAKRLRKGRLNQGSGKLKNRALNTLNCDWDFEAPKQEYFDELFRVSKRQIIWGGNYYTYRIVDGLRCGLPPTRGIIIWDKMQPWENFSQFEYAWSSFDMPAAVFRYSCTADKNRIHPTQKPVDLYKWILNRYAKEGDKILDTHVGSGSSLIACRETGHKYVGFEIDAEYYAHAKKRIGAAEAQVNIFDLVNNP